MGHEKQKIKQMCSRGKIVQSERLNEIEFNEAEDSLVDMEGMKIVALLQKEDRTWACTNGM
jgi:hypothetical protein